MPRKIQIDGKWSFIMDDYNNDKNEPYTAAKAFRYGEETVIAPDNLHTAMASRIMVLEDKLNDILKTGEKDV